MKQKGRRLPAVACFRESERLLCVFLFCAAVVHFCGRHVAELRINNIVPGVSVVVLDPGHAKGEAFLITPFRSDIEEVVRANVHIESARKSRVRVKDSTGFVLVKRAEAWA